MKFQDSSFNGLKVTVGTKSVTHARTHPRSKSNMPHQLFQSWGHNYFYREPAVDTTAVIQQAVQVAGVVLTTIYKIRRMPNLQKVYSYFKEERKNTVSHFSYAPLFQGPHFLTKMLESNIFL